MGIRKSTQFLNLNLGMAMCETGRWSFLVPFRNSWPVPAI